MSKIVNVVSNVKTKVKIYPSVSSGILTIENAQTVQIINAVGQIVLSQTATTPQLSLNIQHLTSGFYTVRGVDTEGSAFAEKIVKQ